jgi:recombination protein RecT
MNKNKDNLPAIRKYFEAPNVGEILHKRLGEKAGTFTTSLIDLCSDDKNLSKCSPGLIMKEALKAAALDLPINKNLGFAYVIPYGNTPSFQMGWKGYVQLAVRTGQYKHLNTGIVYEGEEMIIDRIRGTLEIGGEKTSEKAIGYYCYMELLNGFQKAIAWTKEKVTAHGKRFSKSFKNGPWKTDFDAMALKTMFLQLVPKYGPMTIEMSTAMANDRADFKGFNAGVQEEIDQNANEEVIDIPGEEQKEPGEMSEDEKDQIKKDEANAGNKPDF